MVFHCIVVLCCGKALLTFCVNRHTANHHTHRTPSHTSCTRLMGTSLDALQLDASSGCWKIKSSSCCQKKTPVVSWKERKLEISNSVFRSTFFQTDAPSDFTLVAQSYKNDEDGEFYGTYTAGLGTVPVHKEGDSGSKLGVYRACLEVKCPPIPWWRSGHGYSRPSDDEMQKYVRIRIINRNTNNQCILR